MNISVDIGNSHIKIGVFDKDEMIYNFSLVTDVKKSVEEYKIALQHMITAEANIKIEKIEGVVVSSVVTNITERIVKALSFLKVRILLIGDPDVKTGIVARIDNPEELGGDIVSNLVAAKNKYEENFIVIDMGTATTIMVCGGNGDLIGGVIAPGCDLLIPALSDSCCLLPNFKIKQADFTLTKNTIDAMNSGAYFGYLGSVKELVQRLKEESNINDLKVCATGGISTIFINEMPFIDEIIPNLTLQGLNLVWKMNK